MLNRRIVVHLLTVVSLLSGRADSCVNDMASTCPYYALVNQVTFIPIPDPEHLDTVCSQLQQGLRCLLRPSMLGNCDAFTKAVYTSILNVLQFPCQRHRSAYLSGQECWKSSALKNMLKMCYVRHRDAINADYCTGQKAFVHCTVTDILTVEHCGQTERRVLTDMVVTSYNNNGLVMKPPCPELAIVEANTTITPTTTTTTTTPTTPTKPSATPQSTTRQQASPEPSSQRTKTMTDTNGREAVTSAPNGLMTQASRGGGGGARSAAMSSSWLTTAGVVLLCVYTVGQLVGRGGVGNV